MMSRRWSATSTTSATRPGVNIATRSPGATQHVTVVNVPQIVQFAAAVREAMPALGLDEAKRVEAERLVEQLTETTSEADPGAVRRAVGRLGEIMTTAAGGALGTVLGEVAMGVLHAHG